MAPRPGAHYQRMFGEDFNPYLYALMGPCSDHKHFAGSDGPKPAAARLPITSWAVVIARSRHDLPGRQLADEYRHRLMMANIHGNRLLYDELERSGSGNVARHGKSFLLANDPWFRGVTVAYGPDGGVFASDWNDLG